MSQPNPMTPSQRIAHWRELANAATPGPWRTHDSQGCYYVSNVDDGLFAAFDERICELAYPYAREDRRKQDLEFIAAARTALPQLADALEEALRGLEMVRKLGAWYASTHQGPEHEVHHALKVEVPHEAEIALARVAAHLGGAG